MQLLYNKRLFSFPFSKVVKKAKVDVDIFKTSLSVVLSEDVPATPTYQPLSPQQKRQLGLMIVKSPFNIRMSMQKQLEYLPSVTTELYAKQSAELNPKVRILELPRESTEPDMLKLTNVIYKDIYARYLVSRGIGVRWQGDYSQVGALNPEPVHNIGRIYKTFLKAYRQANVYIKKVPTLYSLTKQIEVLDDDVIIETINRIGGFVLAELTQFGNYEQQFRPLKQKNGRVSLMLFVSKFWTLAEMKAVCLKSQQTYIVVKRENSEEYYITALEHFKSQKEWFTKQQFFKHLLVTGKEFNNMKVKSLTRQNVPIIMEISDYDRIYGSRIYPVAPAHILSDYERGLEYKLSLESNIQTDGIIHSDLFPSQLNILDKNTDVIVKEYLNRNGLLVDLNDVCEQEIFLSSKDRELLFLIPIQRLFVRVSDKMREKFLNQLKYNCTVEESKIDIPRMNRRLHGKYRRRFKKYINRLLQQRTEYQTLDEALKLQEICISTTADRAFPVPVFQRKSQFIMPSTISQQILRLSESGPINLDKIESMSATLATKKIFYLSKNFVKAALGISSNAEDSETISNVVIEPQSQTEGVLKYTFTLAAALNHTNFSLIKLHPTLDESYQDMSVKTLILGAPKANDQLQYGYGFDPFRLWVASKDNDKGNRKIKQADVTIQTTNINYLRKCFWQLLSYIKHINPTLIPTYPNSQSVPFFDRFMLDHADYYILNMQKAYNSMNIHKAHTFTMEFFRDIVTEIYLKSTTKKLIAYPGQSLSHLTVFKRLLECLAVVNPLIPFSSMHISQVANLQWPKVVSANLESLQFYNKLIKYRAELRDKLTLNKLHNVLIYVEGKPDIPEGEFALFLDVRSVTYDRPQSLPQRFSMKRAEYPTKVYFYLDTCYRCDPKNGNKEYLCTSCQSYMKQYPLQQLT